MTTTRKKETDHAHEEKENSPKKSRAHFPSELITSYDSESAQPAASAASSMSPMTLTGNINTFYYTDVEKMKIMTHGQFIKAIEQRNHAEVKRYLHLNYNHPVFLNKGKEDKSTMHLAVASGHLGILRELMNHPKIDLDTLDDHETMAIDNLYDLFNKTKGKVSKKYENLFHEMLNVLLLKRVLKCKTLLQMPFLPITNGIEPTEIFHEWLNKPGNEYKEIVVEFTESLQEILVRKNLFDDYKYAIMISLNSHITNKKSPLETLFDLCPELKDFFYEYFDQENIFFDVLNDYREYLNTSSEIMPVVTRFR
jgi:hypothetical protein